MKNTTTEPLSEDGLDYSKAKENLQELQNVIESRIESDRGTKTDDERLKYILESDKSVRLTHDGGFFIDIPLDEDLQNAYGNIHALDNSEIPSHMGIYSEKFNPDKGVVKIHIH
jgi:hypothetical protein